MQRTSKLKLLFTLTPAFNSNAGGVQRTTYKLGKFFTEQGIHVSYYSMADTGHETAFHGSMFHASEPGGAASKANQEKFINTLKEIRPDIVINQMPYERGLTDTLAFHKKSLNYVLLACLHNSLFSVVNNLDDYGRRVLPRIVVPFAENNISRRILILIHKILHARDLRHILEQHDKVILLTPPNKDELSYFVEKYQQEKVLAIPNSISKGNTGLFRKEKIILHVGRINLAQKRSDLLLPYWRDVHLKLPDWRFVIVGDGPHREIMESEIQEEKIPRVQMVGFQNPEHYYEIAAIFMMPSAFEGFPNTILEAQSYGCPVIAFNSYGALGWIVNDGIDALLIKPYDTTQMAVQTVALVLNPSRLTKMKEAALRNAGRFTDDNVGKLWLQMLNELRP